ncbi:MAG: helix-turn-helix domain-containing protein [Eubacterium sp.]|nr:helix-turn-helix domain-containing protein [Eubacterium sp.]
MMKYSLWQFKNWYEQHNISLSSFISDTDCDITTLTLCDTLPESYEKHTAFILPADILDDCSGFRSALYYNQNRLLFPVTSPEELFNLGHKMMETYQNWTANLTNLIFSDTPISTILNQAQTKFPFPLCMYHKNGTILYHSDDWPDSFNPDTVTKILPYFQQDSSFGKTFFLQAAAPSEGTYIGYIPNDSSGEWALFTKETDHKLQPGDLHIFMHIANILEHAFSFEEGLTVGLHPMSKWFSLQLDSNSSSITSNSYLFNSDWEYNDYYMIAGIHVEEAQTTIYSRLIDILTNKDFCCVPATENIAILIHLGNEFPADLSVYTNRLQSLCKGYCVHIGLSLVFHGLQNISEYYTQAQSAVLEAQDRNVMLFSLVDELAKYILKSSQSIPEVRAYLHPEIQKLSGADKTSGDQLLTTLYTYIIMGRSISRTADALFIHRNTLRNRLNKIRQLISIDPDDEAQAEHILLSLIIHPKDC